MLEKDSNRIVSWAFDKFYEFGESAPSFGARPNLRHTVTNASARFERKYDGVLIKVVRLFDGQLLVSTNGRIDAASAPIFGHVADQPESIRLAGDGPANISHRGLDRVAVPMNLKSAFVDAGGFELPYTRGRCYAFELLHPAVMTVVPATAKRLVHLMTRELHGCYDELPCEERFDVPGMVHPSEAVAFRSFNACRNAARLLPWDDEGFVVVDGKTRVKVKSDAFRSMQRLLVGDSECPDEDAVAVALTLGRARAPVPPSLAALIGLWRRRAEVLAAGCASRLNPASLLAARAQSAHAARTRIEAALGGRMPRAARAVLAAALQIQAAESRQGMISCDAEYILRALRSSRLPVSEIKAVLATVN